MKLSRDKIQRMIDVGSGGSSGGVGSSELAGLLAGYATESWVDEHYISIDFFSRLFQAHGTEEIDVMPNDMDTAITSVESMFGFWTNLYISALGSNGAAPAGISLGMLTDVVISGTPSAGQVLTFDAVTQKWVNGNAQAGATALANLTDVTLSQVQNGDTLLYDSTTSKWYNSALKTINGQSLIGSGDISVGGGASGNYLPLAGGTMTGQIYFGDSASSGVNNSGMARIGRIDHTSGGFVVQLGGENTLYTNFEVIDRRWTQSLFGVGYDPANEYSSSTYIGSSAARGKFGDLNRFELSVPFQISSSGYSGHPWIFCVGNLSGGVLIGYSSNTGYIGTHNYKDLFFKVGNIGIGREEFTPTYKLHVNGSIYSVEGSKFGNVLVGLNSNGTTDSNACIEMLTGTAYIDWHYNGSSADKTSRIIEETSGVLTFSSTGIKVENGIYCLSYITALSDARKKDVMGNAELTVEQVAQAPAIKFLWKDKERRKEGMQAGSIAQYWQTVLPEVVMDRGGELSMQYGVAALVSAIITARKVVDHERRIAELEKENERLKEEISQLRLN